MKLKRHFYLNKHYFIDEEEQVVRLTPEFHEKLKNKKLWNRFGFKKIGGSSVGDVLQTDGYKSEFMAFCRMSWISQPILDRKYVDAGIAIEPKVINLIKEISGKEVQVFQPEKYNYDFFADKDDVVGGLPDGFIKETKTVLEIKTTGAKNLEKWEKWGIPAGYLKQAQLYSYLMGVENYSIVATFLQEEDYVNPNNYPIKERKTKNWNFKVNPSQVKDDIFYIKNWYSKYKNSGVSPKYNLSKDAELLEWLKVSNEQEQEALEEKWIAQGKLVI